MMTDGTIFPCILCGERPSPRIMQGLWVMSCSCARGVVRSNGLLAIDAWNKSADDEDAAKESRANKW